MAKFWDLMAAESYEEAAAVLDELATILRAFPAAARAIEILGGLEEALAAALAAAGEIGAGFTLGGGGIIICIAIVCVLAIGGGSQPVYADEGRGGLQPSSWRPGWWRPKPDKELEKMMRALLKNPSAVRGLVTAPKMRTISPKARKAAYRLMHSKLVGKRI